jgi:hypothetical protein
LTDEEKKMYNHSVENRRIEMSVEYTRELEAKHAKAVEIAKNLISLGLENTTIAKGTDLTIEQTEQLRSQKA